MSKSRHFFVERHIFFETLRDIELFFFFNEFSNAFLFSRLRQAKAEFSTAFSKQEANFAFAKLGAFFHLTKLEEFSDPVQRHMCNSNPRLCHSNNFTPIQIQFKLNTNNSSSIQCNSDFYQCESPPIQSNSISYTSIPFKCNVTQSNLIRFKFRPSSIR